MRGQRKNPRKAVQPFENKKRKIDIFKNYEANGVEKIQRKLEIFSTLISKKSSLFIRFVCFKLVSGRRFKRKKFLSVNYFKLPGVILHNLDFFSS